tara:strand:+ start:664 stop:1158 length:495 start_codon:yes stop_codon:yes gene_type:complete
MLHIILKPTDRAERYCKRDNIELIRVQQVLNFIAQYIDHRKKIEIVNISIDIDCRKADSEYNFQSKHVLIAGITENHKKIKTRKGRLKYFFEHLVHEFRHCMQEVMFNKDASDVTYESTADADYADNPLEIDAMWFEKKFAKKALNLYFALRKAKVKNIDVFYG